MHERRTWGASRWHTTTRASTPVTCLCPRHSPNAKNTMYTAANVFLSPAVPDGVLGVELVGIVGAAQPWRAAASLVLIALPTRVGLAGDR